jgi:hypothetical protein
MKTEDLGALLKAVTDSNPEAANKLEEMLKTANGALKESKVFEEKGTSNPSNGDSFSKIEAQAAELIQKSAGKLTREQAITQIYTSNPGLYTEYKTGVNK